MNVREYLDTKAVTTHSLTGYGPSFACYLAITFRYLYAVRPVIWNLIRIFKKFLDALSPVCFTSIS